MDSLTTRRDDKLNVIGVPAPEGDNNSSTEERQRHDDFGAFMPIDDEDSYDDLRSSCSLEITLADLVGRDTFKDATTARRLLRELPRLRVSAALDGKAAANAVEVAVRELALSIAPDQAH